MLEGKALALSGPIPGMGYPYSDHEGLEATFTLKRREEPHCPVPILMTGMLLEGGRVKCVCDHTYLVDRKEVKVCVPMGGEEVKIAVFKIRELESKPIR